MIKFKNILKRVGFIFLSFAIAVLIGFSSVKHPNTIVASAEDNSGYWNIFDLGILSDSTPSGYGDPYVRTGTWYHPSGLYEYLDQLNNGGLVNLNTGVISFDSSIPLSTDYDRFHAIYGAVYSMLGDAYNIGGEYNIGAVLTLSSGMNSISIYFVNTPNQEYTCYVMDNSNLQTTYLVQNSMFVTNNYILPYNNMTLTDIQFTRVGVYYSYRDVIYNLRMNNITYDEFNEALYYGFPLCQSYNYIAENGGGQTEISPDYANGYDNGFDSGYNNGYNKGYDSGYNVGYDNAESYYSSLIEQARQEGFNAGKDEGLLVGRYEGLEEGKLIGRTEGFNEGVQDYIRNHGDFSWYGLFSSVVEVPVVVFSSLFDFEVMGVNLAGFLVSILSILVMVFILKKIL